MKRALLITAAFALSVSACLDPAKSPYTPFDSNPPALLTSKPAQLPVGADVISPNDTLVLIFSEALDVRSLRPGITVRKGTEDVDVDVFPEGDGGTAQNRQPSDQSGLELQYPVGVTRTGGTPWDTTGTYALQLSTLLVDEHGNALPNEIDIKFQAVADGGTP